MAAQQDLMNRIYRFQSPLYDITRKFYLLGRDRLLEKIAEHPFSSALEVGCGTGRNLFKLNKLLMGAQSKDHPLPTLVGVDICDALLYQAEMRKRAKHTHLTFVNALAEEFSHESLGLPPFEVAFCSYSLSMIPHTQACLENIHRNLAENGRFYIVDFSDFKEWPSIFRKAHEAWLNLFHVRYQHQTFEAIHASGLFTLEEEAEVFGGYAKILKLKKK